MPTDEYGNEVEEEGDQKTPFQQQREQIEKLQKELKPLKKELEDLRSFKAEAARQTRASEASETFQQLGLNPKHAQLFVALNPEGEVSREAVAKFALDNALGTPQATESSTPVEDKGQEQAQEQQAGGFRPVQTDGSLNPSTARLSHADYRKLLVTDVEAALKAVSEGRVDGMYQNPESV